MDMDTKTLTEALRNLSPGQVKWKLALYNTRKSRDGLELEWTLCNMDGVAGWVDTLRETLLTKGIADKSVSEYSPFHSDKEVIGALEKDNELIRDPLADMLLGIANAETCPPEDFVTGTVPKPVGYAFYGEFKDEDGDRQQLVLMRRGNPFLSGSKVRLCTSKGDRIVESEKPLLKFASSVDFLMIGDACYFLSSAIEKDFGMANRHFAIASRRMDAIVEAGIVSDSETLAAAVMTAKNARKFLDFDSKVLDHIARLSIVDRDEFLTTYGVSIDNAGLVDTSDNERCELFIDLLCCRSCLDPLGRLSVASGITPRE